MKTPIEPYTTIRQILRKIRATGRATVEDGFDFRDAINVLKSWCGMEIIRTLERMREAIWDLQSHGDERRGLFSTARKERVTHVRAERAALNFLERSSKELPDLFGSSVSS